MSETQEVNTTDRRLFVGNLPGRVSPHQIADALVDFAQVSVCVFNPSVRGPRGSAFAFVTFANTEDCERGLEALKDLKIGPRTATVEKAEPNKKRATKSETDESEETANTSSQEKPSTGATETAEAEADAQPKKAVRPPRKQLPESADTVYVSNIPLDVTSEQVAEIFSEFKDAHVTIITKEPRKRRQSGRLITLAAKAYAFVKVGDDAQQKAIDALNGTEFKGEKITVSKATVSPEDVEE